MVKVVVESVSVKNEENNKEYVYTYSLVKSKKVIEVDKEVEVYGVEVETQGLASDYMHTSLVVNFTTSKDYTLKIIKELAENKVSSVHLIDILSDKLDDNIEIEYEYYARKCL